MASSSRAATRAVALVLLLALFTDYAQAANPTPPLPKKKIAALKKPVAPTAAPKPVVKVPAQKYEDHDEPDYSQDLFVDGYVYCATGCIGPKKATPKTGTPVKGAIVGVTCDNLYGLKTDYGSASTDAKGYFLVDLPEYDLPAYGVSKCRARLVSAPGPDCHFRTDVNKGHSGAPLGKKKKVGNKVIFTVGPFFTVPNKCAYQI